MILLIIAVPVYIVGIAAIGTSATTTTDSFGNTTTTAGAGGLGLFFALVIGVAVLQVLYHVGFVAVKGQTPGAMIVKVRVVRASDGQIPGWGPAFMRWVPNLVNFVPCVGGLLYLGLWIWALISLFTDTNRQTPFDKAAKTYVIDA